MKRAAELAAAFDRSFAESAAVEGERGIVALEIRAGGATYLLRLSEVALVTRIPKIVPLPHGRHAQLGIAGIRGSLVTVFSLASLLGTSDNGASAWVVRLDDVALAFEHLDGQITLDPGQKPPHLLDLRAILERAK